MTVDEALAHARERIESAEAKLLLRHVLGCPAAELVAHPERELAKSQSSRYAELVARRAAGEPIAYLVGYREFYGRDFRVTPAVLIPRPETELLVEVALGKVSRGHTARILDLGAGSGCVAITLALELDCEVTAVDVSPETLAVARDNAARFGAHVNFVESDWFSAIDGEFDLIVGNPPYVAEGDKHLSEGDLRFEPAAALACGADGLSAIRRILTEAPRYLKPGGWLLLEHGYDQAEAMRTLLTETGFTDIEQHRDLAGIVRVSGGRRAEEG
ncbi:MAG: peptide chain release factor N(5)-glutamine methyltransferase [Gammaproteobacteria bacterium]|nr:peptide chain release factor N(5)-glutamine methyltransferase [Gammaproteobacteria bacterium]MBU1416832.1 peptide chain release factor N(5)-glutamine methyltransferase [Gammaproteobacteria bacterium]